MAVNLIWTLMSLLNVVQNVDIDLPQSCEIWHSTAHCNNNNFTSIPLFLQKASFLFPFNIDLSKNLITEIPSNLYTDRFLQATKTRFKTALCLVSLNLNDNKILKIDEGAFQKEPECLKQLHLSNNLLTTNSISQLESLQALQSIDLSFNYFPVIVKQVFSNFRKLGSLNLEYCQINNIESNSFENLSKLSNVNWKGNFLTFFKPNTFAGLKSLTKLDISFIPFNDIKVSYFDGLLSDARIYRETHINLTAQTYKNGGVPSQTLIIDEGVPERLKPFTRMCEGKQFFIITLSKWKARNVSKHCATGSCYQEINCFGMLEFPKLIVYSTENKQLLPRYHIRFFNSKISEIPSNLYQERLLIQTNVSSNTTNPMPVESLNLESNGIQNIHELAFVGEPGILTQLRLSDNNLTLIPTDAFSHLKHVEDINLHGNNFSEIKAYSFKPMPSLEILDLSKCGIRSIEALAFDGLRNLRYLDLFENKLRSISKPGVYGLSSSTRMFS